MSRPTTRSYLPGTWFGILGDRATVLLPPSEKARAAALWNLVDDGAGYDEVLETLVAGGLRQLPGFVLVSEVEEGAVVVVRGAARACLTSGGETVELEGSGASTWVERTLTSVSAMVLEVGAPAGDTELQVGNGLVRVSRVSVLPNAAQGPAPPPIAADHDGLTRTGREEPRSVSPPGIPGQPPAPSVLSHPVARLIFSSGETVDVDRAIVVGRAPGTRRLPADGQPRLVSVPSPQQEISSTHLELRPGSGADHGSAVVTDLGSTNGTVVTQPGLPPEDLRPGVAVQLVPGAVVDLGDGVTIQVLNP